MYEFFLSALSCIFFFSIVCCMIFFLSPWVAGNFFSKSSNPSSGPPLIFFCQNTVKKTSRARILSVNLTSSQQTCRKLDFVPIVFSLGEKRPWSREGTVDADISNYTISRIICRPAANQNRDCLRNAY
jgi:hypothetical protein